MGECAKDAQDMRSLQKIRKNDNMDECKGQTIHSLNWHKMALSVLPMAINKKLHPVECTYYVKLSTNNYFNVGKCQGNFTRHFT